MTGLAVFIAGDRGADLSDEWRGHLSGESGAGLPADRQMREAAGFVFAAVRCRLQDTADLGWRLADKVLVSRARSNTFVWLPSLIAVTMVLRREGIYGVVVHFESLAALGGFLTLVIHAGRKWRGMKPSKREPRRRSELVRLALTRPRVTSPADTLR